jgi:hypothetical protein
VYIGSPDGINHDTEPPPRSGSAASVATRRLEGHSSHVAHVDADRWKGAAQSQREPDKRSIFITAATAK